MNFFISINGVKHPASIGIGTAYLFCKKTGIELEEFEKRFSQVDPKKLTLQNYEDNALLVICAMENAAVTQGKEPPDFAIPTILDWMQNEPQEYERFLSESIEGIPDKEADQGNPKTPPKKQP